MVPILIVGFLVSFLFLSCHESTNDLGLQNNHKTDIRTGFCNPGSSGSNCGQSIPRDITINVGGCNLKVNYKVKICIIGVDIRTINVSDFVIDWANSAPCLKIGYINNSIPAYGNGDWANFLARYNSFFKEITDVVELNVINEFALAFHENSTLDWIESKCLKFCGTYQEATEEPSLPAWNEYTCSLDGCCFRRTFYKFEAGQWVIHARNTTPGGVCSPEIPVNCDGSSCEEPCNRM